MIITNDNNLFKGFKFHFCDHMTSVFGLIKTKLSSFIVPQAETTQANLRPEQQAKQSIVVRPFSPFNNRQQNYLYISTATNRVSVGERLSVKLSITTTDQTHRGYIKHITYLVRRERRSACPVSAEQMKIPDDDFFS